MTCVDVLPLSAVATICDGQFEKTGAEISVNKRNIYLIETTTRIRKRTKKSIWKLNCYSQSVS